jgi:Ca-activated chloride channel family protein
MDSNESTLRGGNRVDLTVEFLSRRTVGEGDRQVDRLKLRADSMGPLTVLTTPESEPIQDLKTGADHELRGLLGARPTERLPTIERPCPNCSGALREAGAVDRVHPAVAEAAAELGLAEPFGILDGRATLVREREHRVSEDDWTPMRQGYQGDLPAAACTDCNRRFSSSDLSQSSVSERHPGEDDDVTAAAPPAAGLSEAEAKTNGLSVFRETIAAGFTPEPQSITEAGLFSEYGLSGGGSAEPAEAIPETAAAVGPDPLDETGECYLSVGLDALLGDPARDRPQLELVVVLDISGSMESPVDLYQGEDRGQCRQASREVGTKLDAATRSVAALTERLAPTDRLGVVLVNDRAHVAKPLRAVEATDMRAIRGHLSDINGGGGTNVTGGYDAAAELLVGGPSPAAVERRVMLVTDMMPTVGTAEGDALLERIEHWAGRGVHTTFARVGRDRNAALTDAFAEVPGATDRLIRSAAGFEQRLEQDFDRMLFPVAYDLVLEIPSDGMGIEAAFGTPGSMSITAGRLEVGTLFPAPTIDGPPGCGVVLLRVERPLPGRTTELGAVWTDRGGAVEERSLEVELPSESGTFTHRTIRTGVALARYARELREWTRAVYQRADGADDWQMPATADTHDRRSVPLVVPESQAQRFAELRGHLAAELAPLGVTGIDRELQLLDQLATSEPASLEEYDP